MSAETIYAPATLVGRAGVSVVRLSGPDVVEIVERLTKKPCPEPRYAALRKLYHPTDLHLFDYALVLYFKNPNSFTGEDVAEFHLHGGRAVMAEMISALESFSCLRPAQAGEFSRRGFENGKMDLTEAEAIADLVDAETSAQHKQALRQMGGALATLYDGWTDRLAKTLAHIEADLEFPDEDLPTDLTLHFYPTVGEIAEEIRQHVNDGNRGERIRDGIHISIIGPPNAGKSSLLNLLAKRDVAIVNEQAGTTRDIVEVQLDLAGYPVTLSDTAGLREHTDDQIEIEGINRAKARAAQSDFNIIVLNGTELEASLAATQDFMTEKSVLLINKSDLATDLPSQILGIAPLVVSVTEGDNIDQFLDLLARRVEEMFGQAPSVSLTRARHRHALVEALEHIDRAYTSPLPELFAEDLRLAVRSIGMITGKIDVEDLLDIIFNDFCIGK